MIVGASSIVINNEIGTMKQSAGFPDQQVESIRDDLEANALYLADEHTRVLFVTCDMAALETARVERYVEAMAAAAGLDTDSIIIGCSHTRMADRWCCAQTI